MNELISEKIDINGWVFHISIGDDESVDYGEYIYFSISNCLTTFETHIIGDLEGYINTLNHIQSWEHHTVNFYPFFIITNLINSNPTYNRERVKFDEKDSKILHKWLKKYLKTKIERREIILKELI